MWEVDVASRESAAVRTALRRPDELRDPAGLLADANRIRRLLADLHEDDHELRVKLIEARMQLRYEAALHWHDRGLRPISDRGGPDLWAIRTERRRERRERLTAAVQTAAEESGTLLRVRTVPGEALHRMAWRVLKMIAGLVLMVVGILLIPFPGPGALPAFALGLGLFLAQFEPGRRVLTRVRLFARDRFGSDRVRGIEKRLPREVLGGHDDTVQMRLDLESYKARSKPKRRKR